VFAQLQEAMGDQSFKVSDAACRVYFGTTNQRIFDYILTGLTTVLMPFSPLRLMIMQSIAPRVIGSLRRVQCRRI